MPGKSNAESEYEKLLADVQANRRKVGAAVGVAVPSSGRKPRKPYSGSRAFRRGPKSRSGVGRHGRPQ